MISAVLPVDRRPWRGTVGGHRSPHRALSDVDGTAGLAPSTIHRRLSTTCGYYRFAHIDGRCAGCPARSQRRAGVRSVRREHRGPRRPARAPDAGDRGQGATAGGYPPRTADGPHHRSCGRGASRRADPVPAGRPAPRSSHRASKGGFDRQTGRAWRRASAHAPGRFRWPPWTPESRCGTSRSRPVMPTPAPPRSMTGAARTSTVTPPTSWSPSSPAESAPPRHSGDGDALRPPGPGHHH